MNEVKVGPNKKEEVISIYRKEHVSTLLGNIFTLIDDMEQWVGEQDGEWPDNQMPVEAVIERLIPFMREMRDRIETARDLVR